MEFPLLKIGTRIQADRWRIYADYLTEIFYPSASVISAEGPCPLRSAIRRRNIVRATNFPFNFKFLNRLKIVKISVNVKKKRLDFA